MSESETPPEEEVLEERQVGLAEASVLSQMQNWQDLVIEQVGPDTSEVLFRIYFYVCPICDAVIPATYEEKNFQSGHNEYHLRQARDFDAINKVVDILRSLVPKGEDSG